MLLGNEKASGQGYTEYIVLLSGVLAIAFVIYQVVQTIQSAYETRQADIEGIAGW